MDIQGCPEFAPAETVFSTLPDALKEIAVGKKIPYKIANIKKAPGWCFF